MPAPGASPSDLADALRHNGRLGSRLTTERTLTFIEFGFAFTAAYLGFADLPSAIHVSICVVGLAIGLVAVWLWDTPSKVGKSGLAIATVSFYAIAALIPIIREYNREFDVRFKFKESPRLSWWRKMILAHDLSNFERYLRSLGLEVPKSIPPISIADGDEWRFVDPPRAELDRMSKAGWPPPPIELALGKDLIADREVVTRIFSFFIVMQIDDKLTYESLKSADFYVLMGLGCYFAKSYWNEAPPPESPVPCEVMWGVRGEVGKSFADKLAAGAVKAIASDLPQADTPDMRLSTIRAIMIGDSVVEGQCDRWEEIRRVLIVRGFPVPVQTPGSNLSPPALDAYSPLLSRECMARFSKYPM